MSTIIASLIALMVVAILGVATAYLTLWSAIKFHEDFEDRVRSVLLSVVFDVIIVFTLMIYGSANLLMAIFAVKFLFLIFVDLEKTLSQ